MYLFAARQRPSGETWHFRFHADRLTERYKTGLVAHEEIENAAKKSWIGCLGLQLFNGKTCLGQKCAKQVVICGDMSEGLEGDRFSCFGR